MEDEIIGLSNHIDESPLPNSLGSNVLAGRKVFCVSCGIVARESTKFHITFSCMGQTVADPSP